MIQHRDRGWCDCLSCTQPEPSTWPPPPESTERVRHLPLTRGECADGPRPCPWSSCRYHLEHGGESCALDVADRGEHYGREVAEYLGLTRQAVEAIERRALDKLERRVASMRGELDGQRHRPMRDRILAMLADGPVEAADVVLALGAPATVREAFATLLAAGLVRASGVKRASVWALADEVTS